MATVAEKLIRSLKDVGVRWIFGVPSGSWVDYMAVVEQESGIEFVLVSNEASGGFMADACWRLTGQMAACFGTFGPGACNLSTGVCCGYLDRSPMIALTDEMDDRMVARTAQMNIDHQKLFAPITKTTVRLDPSRVEGMVYDLAGTAAGEVPGPVHIGLPAGGTALMEAGEQEASLLSVQPLVKPEAGQVEEMVSLFNRSARPILALGLSAVRHEVRSLVKAIAEKFSIPVVLTPMAKGLLPESHPCYAGVLAHALSDTVAQTHQKADLVVGIGYDPVEINYEDWMPPVPLVHVDTVPADIDTGKYPSVCNPTGDLSVSLSRLLETDAEPKTWDMERLARHRMAMFARLQPSADQFSTLTVLMTLRSLLLDDGIMTCDVGAHLHLIGQQWRTPAPELQLMTNGCSSMGYAIPAAIAAKMCRPEREVACVVGDGGLLMMAGEMATAMRLGRRIVFVVITDRYLSLIRIKQEKKGYRRTGTPLFEEHCPLADSLFGVPVLPADSEKTIHAALREAFSREGPTIVEAFVSSESYDHLILRGNK